MTEAPAADPSRPVPDAPRRNWVDRFAPVATRPYLRLARIDRPIGWWLLLLPCWWSAALVAVAAGSPFPHPQHLVLFLIGAIAMRGAGSTYNDIVDRDLDRQVRRTRDRPLPSGQVGVKGAVAFMVAQALVGLLVLVQFNPFAIVLGLGSLALVALYPFMKRVIAMPQFVLGLAFSWGALMGWAALFGTLHWPAMALYVAAMAWTIGYDTIYALQDFEDDEVVGIRSSARLFGEKAREGVAFAYLVTILAVTAALVGAGASPVGYLGAFLFALHLHWQVRTIRLGDPARALMLFRSNRTAGLILFAGLALDAMMQHAVMQPGSAG